MEKVKGFDQEGKSLTTNVVQEKPLTIFFNNQEIVTLMSIKDYPQYYYRAIIDSSISKNY